MCVKLDVLLVAKSNRTSQISPQESSRGPFSDVMTHQIKTNRVIFFIRFFLVLHHKPTVAYIL